MGDVFAEDGNEKSMINKIILLLFKVLDFQFVEEVLNSKFLAIELSFFIVKLIEVTSIQCLDDSGFIFFEIVFVDENHFSDFVDNL